ncbi:uncharacterized protein J3D65DRAFT_324155 [Phyllosticta citribraziliensis]|uniref:Sushi domain-containing protein n=1 Tax=Phyllosticta citribraziliensis TaxID=989973 RepID=A0ABR1LT65_9PEZI
MYECNDVGAIGGPGWRTDRVPCRPAAIKGQEFVGRWRARSWGRGGGLRRGEDRDGRGGRGGVMWALDRSCVGERPSNNVCADERLCWLRARGDGAVGRRTDEVPEAERICLWRRLRSGPCGEDSHAQRVTATRIWQTTATTTRAARGRASLLLMSGQVTDGGQAAGPVVGGDSDGAAPSALDYGRAPGNGHVQNVRTESGLF